MQYSFCNQVNVNLMKMKVNVYIYSAMFFTSHVLVNTTLLCHCFLNVHMYTLFLLSLFLFRVNPIYNLVTNLKKKQKQTNPLTTKTSWLVKYDNELHDLTTEIWKQMIHV